MPTRSLHTTMPTGTDGNDFTAPDHLPLLGAMCPRCLCGWQPAAIWSRRLHQRPGNVGRVFGRALGGVGGVGGAPATARPPPSPGRLVRGGWCKGLRDKTETTRNHDDRIWTKDGLLDQKKYGLRNVDIFFIRCIFLPCQADFV